MNRRIPNDPTPSMITVGTSFMFLPSAIMSYFRGCVPITWACIGCFVVAVGYHGCHNLVGRATRMVVVLREVDRVFNHSCIVYFSYMCADISWYYMMAMGSLFYIIVGYYILDQSSNRDYGAYFHATIHLVANLGFAMCLVEACVHNNQCTSCLH